MKKIILAISMLVLSLSITACSGVTRGDVGTVGGGVAGGVIGSAVTRSPVGTIVGAVGGAVAGRAIANAT
jgi:outer membrane lipoprotein SlyB